MWSSNWKILHKEIHKSELKKIQLGSLCKNFKIDKEGNYIAAQFLHL